MRYRIVEEIDVTTKPDGTEIKSKPWYRIQEKTIWTVIFGQGWDWVELRSYDSFEKAKARLDEIIIKKHTKVRTKTKVVYLEPK